MKVLMKWTCATHSDAARSLLEYPETMGGLAPLAPSGPNVGTIGFSLLAHVCVLGVVILSPALSSREPSRTLYEQVIQPHQHQLVWYSFRRKLPEVSPPEKPSGHIHGAELRTSAQTIISKSKTGQRGVQMIWRPVPRIKPQPEVLSPNILAFQLPLITAPLRPQRKRELTAIQAAPKFRQNPALLANLMTPNISSPQRAFIPPSLGGVGQSQATTVPPVVEAPAIDVSGMPSANVNVALVGLNPAAHMTVPLPDRSLDAEFSAAPAPRDGSRNTDYFSPATLSVPGLLVSSHAPQSLAVTSPRALLTAPTSPETLQAAATMTGATAAPDASTEIHLSPPPDPEFDGRNVYTLAVQMPNVSSYVGSWIMWFAEREPGNPRQKLKPPVPFHKVDPKYFPEAMAARVEGKAVLAGVLQTDGRVREIRILMSVDPRLDLSAARALRQWEFEPAQRDGIPVEVDVVAEIPFLLAPKVSR